MFILFDNAGRYRHPERPLRVEISAVVDKGQARIRVADNGSGIAGGTCVELTLPLEANK